METLFNDLITLYDKRGFMFLFSLIFLLFLTFPRYLHGFLKFFYPNLVLELENKKLPTKKFSSKEPPPNVPLYSWLVSLPCSYCGKKSSDLYKCTSCGAQKL